MTPPLPAPADPTEADRKPATGSSHDRERKSDAEKHAADCLCDCHKGPAWHNTNIGCQESLLSSERSKVREERDREWCRSLWPENPEGAEAVGPRDGAEHVAAGLRHALDLVREEDCRAVCQWCAGPKPSQLDEKAKPAAWRDGKWWHLVELPDGTRRPYQFWRECTAAPIRSLSLPEPDPPTAFDRHFLANCKYGEGHAGKCVPWPPKPEPTR